MLLVDFQAGLGFGVESVPRQVVLNNAVALVRTVVAFKVPVIGSTSAARVCQVGRKAPAFLGRGYKAPLSVKGSFASGAARSRPRWKFLRLAGFASHPLRRVLPSCEISIAPFPELQGVE
jgi:hypothetical protein